MKPNGVVVNDITVPALSLPRPGALGSQPPSPPLQQPGALLEGPTVRLPDPHCLGQNLLLLWGPLPFLDFSDPISPF